MTFFLQVEPLQSPFDLGPDEQGWNRVVFNVFTERDPSSTFIEELVAVLEAASVGTFEQDIFASSAVALPERDGPYLTIVETGGAGGRRTQNAKAPSSERATAQIIARGKTYEAARTLARAAYDALAAVKNETVTP